ncbi:hypothetical protein ES708_30094 [subsurface metagenome]
MVDIHGENIGDALFSVEHGQGFRIEAAACADIAAYGHVGQKAHLDLLHPLAGTPLAAAPGDVEGEAAGSVAPHPRLRSAGVELSHLIPEPHVGGGTGSGSLADRRLIDLKDPAHLFPPQDFITADQPVV